MDLEHQRPSERVTLKYKDLYVMISVITYCRMILLRSPNVPKLWVLFESGRILSLLWESVKFTRHRRCYQHIGVTLSQPASRRPKTFFHSKNLESMVTFAVLWLCVSYNDLAASIENEADNKFRGCKTSTLNSMISNAQEDTSTEAVVSSLQETSCDLTGLDPPLNEQSRDVWFPM